MAPETRPVTIAHAFMVFGLWLLFTKTVKLWPYFWCHPEDLKYLHVIVLFGYFFSLIKFYSLLTVHKVGKEGRVGAWHEC